MKKIIPLVTGLISTGILFSACSKDAVKNLDSGEARIYITRYDNTINFGSYATFSVVDSVAVIQNNQFVDKAHTDFDVALRNAFISQMQQRGYTLVSPGDNPDLVINLSRIYNDVTGIIDYSLYYNNYYGYYDPFYWGYSGYGYYFPTSFYGTYTVTIGGVSIDIFDAKNAASSNELKLVWNGLIRGSGTFSTNTIDKSVTALFDQSAYLSR